MAQKLQSATKVQNKRELAYDNFTILWSLLPEVNMDGWIDGWVDG